MIRLANRAGRARKEHRAAQKAVAIGFDARGDCAPGLRAFDHQHSHLNLPEILFIRVERWPAGSCLFSSVRGDLGGHRAPFVTRSERAVVLVRGFLPTGHSPSGAGIAVLLIPFDAASVRFRSQQVLFLTHDQSWRATPDCVSREHSEVEHSAFDDFWMSLT
ncbi:MAG: hypothetical protein ACREDL_22305, partial [Bradyrhizobium sp.]